MNKKKVIFLSIVSIILLFVLIAVSYSLSYIINLYQSKLDFIGSNITAEEKSVIWGWYGSNYIISVFGVVVTSLLFVHFVYVIIKEILKFYEQNGKLDRLKTYFYSKNITRVEKNSSKKRVVLKSIILIAMLFVLSCLSYELSFFIKLYNIDLKSVFNITNEIKSTIWNWYDSYIIILILGIVLLSIVALLFVYLLVCEFIDYVKEYKENNKDEKQNR